MTHRRRLAFAAPALAAAGLLVGLALAQTASSVQRETFDGKQPLWERGPASVPVAEEAHVLTEAHAHSLPSSEYIRVRAEPNGELNPSVYYSFPTHPAPVGDDLAVSVWVRANRSGVRLLARVVLPRERNPDNPGEKLTVLLRGEVYSKGAGQWQRLDLRQPVKLLKDEQQALRTRLNHDILVTDAYVDRVILDLYAAPGVTEVWVDDLEISPVIEPKAPPKGPTPAQTTSRAPGSIPVPVPSAGGLTTPARPLGGGGRVAVEFNREQLRVGGKNFLFRGIRHSDTPLKVLRDAGLNTLFVGESMDPSVYEDAVRQGFWLVPALPAESADADVLARDVTRFQADDAVLFWYLGGDRTTAQIDPVSRAARAVRAADPQRPLGADSWDGLWAYSRHVDLIAAHRFPLMTSLELTQYRDWLNQRRQMTRDGTFFWTWVQTHLQDWFLNVAYPNSDRSRFDEPIGPQAEQIRLLTYLALTAGCKGLGFWSDRFLADSHQGRDRLLAIALLNEELQMLEPLFLGVVGPPAWLEFPEVSVPDVKAAVIRCERGVLVLPLWLGKGAQYVPGQSAANRLDLRVPAVPNGTQPWLVSPGEVKSLPFTRVAGGVQVTLHEFDQSAALVFTSDLKLVEFWQTRCRQLVRLAAQHSYQLAEVERDKVEKVQAQLDELAQQGLAPKVPDAAALLAEARRRRDMVVAAWGRDDYRETYGRARQEMRPLRILMRAQWEAAAKSLGPDAPPTASPYAVSFFTLPRHWRFRQELSQCTPGGNQLADGDFERSEKIPAGWQVQTVLPEEVEGSAKVASTGPNEDRGRHYLALNIHPKVAGSANDPPPTKLDPAYLGVVSPPVRLPPGSLVRVSGWVKLPETILASVDGALLFDSAGGEPLGVRLTAATKDKPGPKEPAKWRHFVLYRRVPPAGVVQVTAALTGIGTAYFDDLAIEPLNPR